MAAKWLLPLLGAGTGTVDAGEAVAVCGDAGGLQAGQMACMSMWLAFWSAPDMELPAQHIMPGSKVSAWRLKTQEVACHGLWQLFVTQPPLFSTEMSMPALVQSHLLNTWWSSQPALQGVTWQTDSPETLH